MHAGSSDYFQSNIDCLKTHHFHLYQLVVSTDIKPEGEIEFAPNGKPNLKIHNADGKPLYLHDETDPEKETIKYLSLVLKEDTGVAVFMGMGLGYGPMALSRLRPYLQHIIVFELSPRIFLRALQVMDLRPLLMDARLSLHVGASLDIKSILAVSERSLQLENIHMLRQVAAVSSQFEAYQKLYDEVFEQVNALNVSGTTIRTFGPILFENRFHNLATIHHQALFDSLKGVFAGVPALLIAGGPSLEKDLHLLPLIKGRAVIIAVDTVLPVLLKNGIKPHFVTTIDPQELVFEKIADALPEVTSDIHLISTISGFPKIPKTFPGGQIFWVFSAKPVEAWLSRLLGCEILTAGAGTVAHLNLLAAVFMKCSPIIFIGQDLAHSRSRSHVPGVSLTAQNKTKEMLKKNKDIQWVKGVDGKPVPTDRAFMDMKHYFERIISENPGHYINATSKGVHIEGTTVLSFTETLKRYALKQYFISDQMKVLSQKRSLSKKELFMNTCADLISDIEVVRSQILKYNKMLSKTIKQVHKLAGSGQQVRCFRDLPAILQKSIQKIDEQSNKIDKAPKIWELVQELTMEALRDSERQKQMISRLAEKPDHYLQWLTVNLDRAETINNVRKDTLQAFHSNLSQAFDFYKKEQRLSQAVSTTEQDNENVEALIRLADLYMDFENFHLAKPLFEKIQITCPDRADTYYKLGIMALHQTHHEMAEKYFKRAIELHPPFETKVMKVRHDFGDIYLSYANLDILDRSVRRRMAIKGIRYCKHHDELRKLINQMASEDLNRIESKNNTEELNEVEDLINFWSDVATREPEGYAGLSVEMRDKFCVYAGKLAWSRGDLEDAKTKIRLVLGKNPDHVEGLQVMAEICFAANNFESGVQYLQQAVSLDLTCAVLWEFVGDRLLAADQPADAAAAYEQCFLYFPEKSELLKKIGECYLALENYDAARQALQIFRDRQPG